MMRQTILHSLRAGLPFAAFLVMSLDAGAQDRRLPAVEYVNIVESRSFLSPSELIAFEVFTVPSGTRLLVDYVSLDLDADVLGVGPVGPVVRVAASLNDFFIGLLDQIELTTRGTPNFVLGKAFPVSFGPGETLELVVSTRLSSLTFDNGELLVNISGKLIPEPEVVLSSANPASASR